MERKYIFLYHNSVRTLKQVWKKGRSHRKLKNYKCSIRDARFLFAFYVLTSCVNGKWSLHHLQLDTMQRAQPCRVFWARSNTSMSLLRYWSAASTKPANKDRFTLSLRIASFVLALFLPTWVFQKFQNRRNDIEQM